MFWILLSSRDAVFPVGIENIIPYESVFPFKVMLLLVVFPISFSLQVMSPEEDVISNKKAWEFATFKVILLTWLAFVIISPVELRERIFVNPSLFDSILDRTLSEALTELAVEVNRKYNEPEDEFDK